MNDALDTYREYEDGEYQGARAVGIFAVRNGMPVGGRKDSASIMRLMHDLRWPPRRVRTQGTQPPVSLRKRLYPDQLRRALLDNRRAAYGPSTIATETRFSG